LQVLLSQLHGYRSVYQPELAATSSGYCAVIAETGGQNVMIADSSALLEQLVQDVIVSAFNSAGQRCQLCACYLCNRKSPINHSHADWRHAGIIHGAIPVFIKPTLARHRPGCADPLNGHLEKMQPQAKLLYQLPLANSLRHGSFFPPSLIEISFVITTHARKCLDRYCT